MAVDLNGWSVLVTRPEPAAMELARRVRAASGIPIIQPGLSFEAKTDRHAERQLASLEDYDGVILTSSNALRFALQLRPQASWPAHLRIMAVGPATRGEAVRAGFEVVIAPDRSSGIDALRETISTLVPLPKRILMLAAPGGRTYDADELAPSGLSVDLCHVYRRIPAPQQPGIAEKIHAARPQLIVIATSQFILESITGMFETLIDCPLVIPSERIRSCAVRLGYRDIKVAEQPDDSALVAAAAGFIGA